MTDDALDVSRQLQALLLERGETIAAAESCTGGLLAKRLTDLSGSSQVFPGGVVSYCDRVKHGLLGVPERLLETCGAVSDPVARAMAKGAAEALGATMALSTTGIAGPEGDGSGQPVGTVFLGLYAGGETRCRACHFSGDRDAVRRQAAETALELAVSYLQSLPVDPAE